MAKLSFEQLIYLGICTALATGIITFFANVLFHYLKNKLDWFSDIKKFKRDFSFEQYCYGKYHYKNRRYGIGLPN